MLYGKKMNIFPAYISKQDWSHENEIVLLTVPHGEDYLHC